MIHSIASSGWPLSHHSKITLEVSEFSLAALSARKVFLNDLLQQMWDFNGHRDTSAPNFWCKKKAGSNFIWSKGSVSSHVCLAYSGIMGDMDRTRDGYDGHDIIWMTFLRSGTARQHQVSCQIVPPHAVGTSQPAVRGMTGCALVQQVHHVHPPRRWLS